MRFKGTFIEDGLRKLEKGFLPTLEKCGKRVQILISEQEDALFTTNDFKVISKSNNQVAFDADLGQLLRALRSTSAHEAVMVMTKLVLKTLGPAQNGSLQAQAKKPFLHFAAKGLGSSLIQEAPVSQPYKSEDVERLRAAKDGYFDAMSPYYVDVAQCLSELQAMTDKMKAISDVVEFTTCKNGDLYISVSATNMHFGAQFTSLDVFPASDEPVEDVDKTLDISAQKDQAKELGIAVSVELHLKHLTRVLTICPISNPMKVLCGVGPQADELHVMFVYQDAEQLHLYDDSIAMSIRLPARMEQ